MKRLKIISVLFCLAFAACNDNDDKAIDPIPTPTNETLEGEWQLFNVSGGIVGTNDDFAPNEVTWVFNEANQTVTVTNNNTDNNKVDFFDSGTYSYEVVTNQTTPELCGFNFAIDNVNLGCFNVTNEEFTMSMVEADGHMITLKRP